MVPFVDHTRLASVITVTAGDGYWRRNQPPRALDRARAVVG